MYHIWILKLLQAIHVVLYCARVIHCMVHVYVFPPCGYMYIVALSLTAFEYRIESNGILHVHVHVP